MRIVFVIDSWNPGNGCIVATHRLVEELQAKGHDIALVTTAGPAADEFKGDVYTVPGFYMPGVKEAMMNMNFQFGRGIKSVLREAFTGADLVQIQFPYFMAAPAVKMARKMDVPVLGACHIQSQNMTGAMGKDNKLMDLFFNSWFNYELFKRVEAIHCPSAFAADLIKSKGSNAHFRVISNGIPRGYEPDTSLKRPEEWGDKFVLVTIGRLAMEKRHEVMIDAIKKSKYKDKIQLLICGKGELEESLKSQAAGMPVEPQIRYISDEEKMLYMNTADMYLHSSLIELESLTCLEAIGCGLPCMISNSPNSAASQFAYNEKFIFEMDDADDLAAKIDYWFEKREELKEMKKDILEMAEQYRMDRSIASMEQLYEDVINYNSGNSNLLPAEEKRFA
ncbi:MAG: glycosyltransferase [Spirochaetales bacterium]|nr:glycosyltransferase [Spirochaetales bacterium]